MTEQSFPITPPPEPIRHHPITSIPVATTPTTVDELLDYWPGNIPFKGALVSEDGTCMCAQGQTLYFLGGLTAEDLRRIEESEADKRVAELFGISVTHSVLLRYINDSRDGAPTCVIRNPEKVIGGQAQVVLAFWRQLDQMSPATWRAIRAANRKAAREAVWATTEAGAAAVEAARAAAGAAAGAVAREAAGEAAWEAAWKSAWKLPREAALATHEIQGAAVMRVRNQPFFFLPLFGFNSPEEIQ